jgi:hypothetical protein
LESRGGQKKKRKKKKEKKRGMSLKSEHSKARKHHLPE